MSNESSTGRFQRNVVAALIVISGVVSLVYLQGTFDQSDRRKSIELVRTYQTDPGTPTLGSWLVENTGGPVAFDAEITSGCEGVVEVTGRTRSGESFVFVVDLVGSQVAPANPAAQRALSAFRAGQRVGTTPPS